MNTPQNPARQPPQQWQYIQVPNPYPGMFHLLHAILTLLTCSIWAIVWIVHAAGWQKTRTVAVPNTPLPIE